MPSPQDRRAYRRTEIQVNVEMSDVRGSVVGRTIDVSRGGLFASTSEARTVGTLLRVRIVEPNSGPAVAVGVVVRSGAPTAPKDPSLPQGIAIALTATSEAWDRYWDDLTGGEGKTGEA